MGSLSAKAYLSCLVRTIVTGSSRGRRLKKRGKIDKMKKLKWVTLVSFNLN
jgi:hypothetical protein